MGTEKKKKFIFNGTVLCIDSCSIEISYITDLSLQLSEYHDRDVVVTLEIKENNERND